MGSVILNSKSLKMLRLLQFELLLHYNVDELTGKITLNAFTIMES